MPTCPGFAREQQLGSMKRLLLKLAITAAVGSLLSSNPTVAQILPPQKGAEHIEITKGPELEIAYDDVAIIRWTTTNPRGQSATTRAIAIRKWINWSTNNRRSPTRKSASSWCGRSKGGWPRTAPGRSSSTPGKR